MPICCNKAPSPIGDGELLFYTEAKCFIKIVVVMSLHPVGIDQCESANAIVATARAVPTIAFRDRLRMDVVFIGDTVEKIGNKSFEKSVEFGFVG